jgi:hypothetical protein
MLQSIRNLDLKEKREVLTLQELSATIDERNIGIDNKRMRHADFITTLGEMVDKRNFKFAIDPVDVRVGGASQMPNITFIQNEAKNYNAEAPVEAHLIRNLAGKIQIEELSDELSNQGLAFCYNQQGIQVAFGMNVRSCGNLSIWGENMMATYGPNKRGIKEIFSGISDWLDLYEKKRAIDVRYMNQLLGIPANNKDIVHLIGDLLVEANKKNMKEYAEDVAPLNDTQVSAFAQEYIRKMAKLDSFSIDSMWDIYNVGTALLRPKAVGNFEPIFRQNKALGQFMVNRYGLVEDYIAV